MIEIVFSACLIAFPASCKDIHLTYMAESVTPMQCMQYGQPHMAEWINVNPQWRIMRFRCEAVREGKVTI